MEERPLLCPEDFVGTNKDDEEDDDSGSQAHSIGVDDVPPE